MTLLATVQRAASVIGIPRPSIVAAATDPTVRLLLELAQLEGEELARYGDWRVLRKEKTFTTVAAETQTDTPIPADFAGFVDETAWNRSARRRLIGPIDPQDWQRYKAMSTFPVTDGFTLRGTDFLMGPVPAAGLTIAYEYRSSHWCQSAGAVSQVEWAADTDTGIISERLMRMGIVWRFKQARGLDWQNDHAAYLNEVDGELARDRPRKIHAMGGDGWPSTYRQPGYTVQDGSWNV